MSFESADQYECTRRILEVTPDALVVANIGVVSYVLAGVEDRAKNFYQWGSMGSSVPLGIGMAASSDEQVTVIDGDGSLLMSLGSLVTAGSHDLSNLAIVVMNNGRFATTGGQPTLASAVDFVGFARASGFHADHVSTPDALEDTYRTAVDHEDPSLVVCDVESIYPEDDRPPRDYNYITYRFRSATEE